MTDEEIKDYINTIILNFADEIQIDLIKQLHLKIRPSINLIDIPKFIKAAIKKTKEEERAI